MSGDYTRNTFSPVKDYLAVLMQQGRVMVDADFNSLNAILDRRLRSETVDIIGRCVVPKETPDGFRIQIAGPSITIGRGRLYAQGLQADVTATIGRGFHRHAEFFRRGVLPVRLNFERAQRPLFNQKPLRGSRTFSSISEGGFGNRSSPTAYYQHFRQLALDWLYDPDQGITIWTGLMSKSPRVFATERKGR